MYQVLDGNRLSSSSALGKAPSLCFFERPLWVYLRLDSRFAFEFPWGELGSSC
ncbi:hypothetical protein ACVWXV_002337 [Thermostichus sp. OS-CIW-21]|jgi:hypothetical protein